MNRLSFDRDTLLLQEVGGKRHCRTSPAAVARLNNYFHSPDIQAILADIRRDPERYHSLEDARGILITFHGEEAQLDYKSLPQGVMTFLTLVDKDFIFTFGRSYRLRLSKGRV